MNQIYIEDVTDRKFVRLSLRMNCILTNITEQNNVYGMLENMCELIYEVVIYLLFYIISVFIIYIISVVLMPN